MPGKYAALVAALLVAAASNALAQGRPPLAERYLAGRLLVQPRPGLPLAALDRLLEPHGARRGQLLRQINVHIVELPPQAHAPSVAAALARSRHVAFAELDGVLQPTLYPDDPRYPSAWHLPRIGAASAWDAAQGAGITIAILDTGVDTAHPDLQGRLVGGWNHFDNNDNVADVHGHGTAIAGVAAAATNNSVGVASVSFESRIMPLRVTDTAGNGFFSLMAAALLTAADSGARVANISFLGVSDSATVDSAAQYMRAKGGVVVTSGGNTGALRTDSPRVSLTAVAATDTVDGRASFSSWGDYIDIAAPGLSVWTTTRGGGYGAVSGTSAASPIVAGVYALMMSAKPSLSAAVLDNILFTTAQDLGPSGVDQEFGHGRVNAAAAVAKALQTSTADAVPPSVAITAPASGPAAGLVPVDVTATDDTGVTRVELYANNALVATDTTSPYGFTVDASKYNDGQLALQARAYDAAGNTGSSETVTLSVSNDTIPPTVSILSPASGGTVSGTVTVSVSAIDNAKVAKVSLAIDGQEVAVSYGASLKYSWSVPGVKGKGKGAGGTSTLTARAEDAGGNTGAATISVSRQ